MASDDGSESSCWMVCSAVSIICCAGCVVFALYVLAWAAIIYALIVLGRIWLLEDPSFWNICAFIIVLFSLLRGSYSEYDVTIRRKKPYEKVKTYYINRTQSQKGREASGQPEATTETATVETALRSNP